MELKDCPICANRRRMLRELTKDYKHETEREDHRLRKCVLGKKGEYKIIRLGYVDMLDECCKEHVEPDITLDMPGIPGGVVSSKVTQFEDGKPSAHIHLCPECGKKYPKMVYRIRKKLEGVEEKEIDEEELIKIIRKKSAEHDKMPEGKDHGRHHALKIIDSLKEMEAIEEAPGCQYEGPYEDDSLEWD